MSDAFTPTNTIEEQLLAAQEGRIGSEAFMQALLQSQLFMPILEQAQTGNLQTSQSAQPLTLEDEEGNRIVILFTSPERGKAFLRDHPGYQGGLLAEFTWILEKLGVGLGLSINPDSPAGIDLTPEMMSQLGGASGITD